MEAVHFATCYHANPSTTVDPISSLKFIIVSDNGSAPNRRQAIIWNNAGHFTDAYMRHSASMS